MNIAIGNVTDNLSATSFASETAKATGKDERSVRRDAERGSKVIGEVIDMITGTKLDTGTYLDKLKRLTPNDQYHRAKNAAENFAAAPSFAAQYVSGGKGNATADNLSAAPFFSDATEAGIRSASP